MEYQTAYEYIVKDGRIIGNKTINSGGKSQYKFNYSYEGSNIKIYNSDDIGSSSQLEFVYGDNKSPYYNSRLKFCFSPYDDVQLFSPNNVLMLKRNSWDGKSTFDFIYEYTFDEEGYPLKAIVKNKLENGTITDNVIETFEYELL